MKFGHTHFDNLRESVKRIDGSLERYLFDSVINDLEKLTNMITETKVDLAKHDKHGAVAMSRGTGNGCKCKAFPGQVIRVEKKKDHWKCLDCGGII